MAKRFTDSDKWGDKWFRRLPPDHKLAYLYLLDQCDHAGVIELDDELAEFHIGTALDWNQFLKNCEGRVVELDCGKLLIVKFIDYQYGDSLSSDCRAHKPVFTSIDKHGLDAVFDSLSIPFPKSNQRGQDIDKDKDKDKDKKKGECEGEDWIVPENLDSPEVRKQLAAFARMRKQIKKPIKSVANTSRILRTFDDIPHLLYAIDFCIANEYQGLKPDYRPKDSGKSPGGRIKTDAKVKTEMQRAGEIRRLRSKLISEGKSDDEVRAALRKLETKWEAA